LLLRRHEGTDNIYQFLAGVHSSSLDGVDNGNYSIDARFDHAHRETSFTEGQEPPTFAIAIRNIVSLDVFNPLLSYSAGWLSVL